MNNILEYPFGELDALGTGEIQPVELVVTVLEDAESGNYSFDVLIQATSDH